MTNPDLSAVKEPLDIVVHQIEVQANKADDHVIAAAMRLRELRLRIEAGEAGDGVKWFEWARKNITKLSESRLFELQTIAESDEPASELERLRRLNRERVKRHREKKVAAENNPDTERSELIAWAKKAPIDDVRKIWLQINGKTYVARQMHLTKAQSAQANNAV